MTPDGQEGPDEPGPARAFAAYRQRGHFSSLDGLRFLCIMAVLWHHAPLRDSLGDAPAFLGRGFLGVDFFFVLSGFLITTLLIRERQRYGDFSLGDFYRRRLLRIVPVYFFLVTAVSAYYVLIKGATHYAALVPFYYLFLSNFLTSNIPTLYPMWSLAVEEQYYLIWPLLLRKLPDRAALPVLALLIAANVAGIMGLFAALGLRAVDIGILHIALPHATYAPILMGSAVAILLHGQRSFSALFRLFGHFWSPLAAFALLLILICLAPDDLRGLPNLAIHLAMSACLISLVIRDDTILRPLMTFAPIARIGVISYGIYLYHLVALQLANGLLHRAGFGAPWAVSGLYVILSIIIADFSFRTLERYFRRFRPQRRPAPAA